MHPVRSPPGLLTLALAAIAVASPYPRDPLRDLGFGYLKDEQCSQYCGVNNEICCSNDESCYTSSGVASCTTAPELDKRDYTTTWTETLTFTSVISSWYVPTTTAGVGTNGEDCVPPEGSGEIACGTICCATWQYCAYKGQCSANAGYSTWTEITTTGVVVTTQYSAPWRPTSGAATATTTTDTTGTLASETMTPTSSMGNGTVASTSPSLSPGAIAGIVIGALAGVVLLLLLCFCCIVRGLWGAFAGILGLGKKKNRDSERVEIIEERYSRHGSAAAAAARPAHRTWFGGGGGRPSTAASRREKKSGGGWGWIAAGAGAAALLLGLRRSDKQKKGAASHRSRSDWSSSYYTDSYTATSPSEFITSR
ncbi:hypothetical protein GGR57DRAFT_133369 [Xylariaceae sp. FL1272]|nr:hypothetical protein GGR57DRAFT_133369 [Xylariaceae sp. FL1272]